MLERPSQRMSAAVGTDPSCIAQESPLLMCSLSLQTHIFQDSVSPRDLYSVRTAASLPPSAVLHTFQKWSQWVDLALRLRKSKRHFSCFWHEKDNVGHRLPSRSFKILFKKQTQTQKFVPKSKHKHKVSQDIACLTEVSNFVPKYKHKHKIIFQKTNTNTQFCSKKQTQTQSFMGRRLPSRSALWSFFNNSFSSQGSPSEQNCCSGKQIIGHPEEKCRKQETEVFNWLALRIWSFTRSCRPATS